MVEDKKGNKRNKGKKGKGGGDEKHWCEGKVLRIAIKMKNLPDMFC